MINATWGFDIILHEVPYTNEEILVGYFSKAVIQYPERDIENAKPEHLERLKEKWGDYSGFKMLIPISSVKEAIFLTDIFKDNDFSATQIELVVSFMAFTEYTYELLPGHITQIIYDLKCKVRLNYTLSTSA